MNKWSNYTCDNIQFDPRSAVLYWLSDEERRHKSTEKLLNKTSSVKRSGSMQHKMQITETKEKRLLRTFGIYRSWFRNWLIKKTFWGLLIWHTGHFCSISKLRSSLKLAIITVSVGTNIDNKAYDVWIHRFTVICVGRCDCVMVCSTLSFGSTSRGFEVESQASLLFTS